MPRRANQYLQEPSSFTFDHPQVTGTTSYKMWKAPFACYVDSVYYINPTGLAAHADDNFKGQVKNGSNVVSSLFDTDADDGATLAADTWVSGTMAASYQAVAAGDTLTLTLTEEGTATLPAGRIQLNVRRV